MAARSMLCLCGFADLDDSKVRSDTPCACPHDGLITYTSLGPQPVHWSKIRRPCNPQRTDWLTCTPPASSSQSGSHLLVANITAAAGQRGARVQHALRRDRPRRIHASQPCSNRCTQVRFYEHDVNQRLERQAGFGKVAKLRRWLACFHTWSHGCLQALHIGGLCHESRHC